MTEPANITRLESGAIIYEAKDGTRYYLPPSFFGRILAKIRRWLK